MHEFYEPELRCRQMETYGESSDRLSDIVICGNDGSGQWSVFLWTAAAAHIYEQRCGYKVRNGDSAVYNGHIFPVWIYGLVPGGASWDGTFRSSDAPLDHRNSWDQNRMDILDFPKTQIPGGSVHLISGVLDHNPCYADSMLFLCEEDAV